MFNEEKLEVLFNHVLNAQATTEKEELEIKTYLNSMFANGTPSQHELHQFNNLVIKKADEIARPKASEILSILADYENAGNVAVFQYDIPKDHKAKVVWSANGTSVEHTRVEGSETRIATPTKLATGFYYEVKSLKNGDAEAFRKLVADVADAKIRLYFQTVSKLFTAAMASGDIPAGNVKIGSNLTLAEFNAVSSKLQRYGGRPVFIGDSSLIDHFAFQQTTDATFSALLTEQLKGQLAQDLNIAQIGRTLAVSLVNPFIAGSGNTVTELPVDEGYFIAGAVKQKPFKIIEFGKLAQWTSFNSNLERVEMKITQEVAFEFIQGEAIGYIKDDTVEA